MWSPENEKIKNSGAAPIGQFGSIFNHLEAEAAKKSAQIVWPNKAKCAVSLAYIGGLPEHVDLAPAILHQMSFRASFFVDPDVVLEEARLWKTLVGSKHEFGCSPFESQSFDGNLYGWTGSALVDELTLAKQFVQDFFEVEAKGLAHRSPSLTINGTNASMVSQNLFKYIVTGSEGLNAYDANVKSLSVTPVISYSTNWLAELGKSDSLTWVIVPIRRLFTESNSSILLHRLILENINRKRKNLWIAPVGEVAAELQRLRSLSG